MTDNLHLGDQGCHSKRGGGAEAAHPADPLMRRSVGEPACLPSGGVPLHK